MTLNNLENVEIISKWLNSQGLFKTSVGQIEVSLELSHAGGGDRNLYNHLEKDFFIF